ncbi:MAG: hypothetical protein ACXVW7_01215 [Trebonia sp.]
MAEGSGSSLGLPFGRPWPGSNPDTIENYRFAHAVQQLAETQQASTEDLREALLRPNAGSMSARSTDR